MKAENKELTYFKIFLFWLPLAATWLMMAVEGPFLAAVIARMAEEKLNLAAYGVAYAFGLVAESPVIMLMSASTALCQDALSYRRLRNFTLWLCLAVTLLLGLFLLPPVFSFFAEKLLGLSQDIAAHTHRALVWLLPWAPAIGLRRFYQGILISAHKTRRVALATIFRLGGMAGTALLLFYYSDFNGAEVGTLSLSIGVTAEAIFTRYLASAAIDETLQKKPAAEGKQMSYRQIWDYYLPLALTPFIGLSIHPLVTFFLGKSRDALDSLAVMPVIYGLTFVFRALGLSYQEVVIALIGEDKANYRKARNFAVCLGLSTSCALSLIAFTPLAELWFRDLSGLSQHLSDFATPALQIMAIFPAFTVLVCWQRAILIDGRITRPVSIATAVEASGIFSLLTLSMLYFPIPGAVAASIAYAVGRLLAVLLLQKPVNRQVKVNFVQD
ncbi:Na+-driven multidrug efflux pump [Malonomonas rubra DSM 5091]|uniref:Na+-driven multidrug efflux pump n=1 Tax=Malonomonas rubra DSM 5091 TaxID=1122189 RepID=A0A1M6I3N0_MALRU|nr:MATE family efflux transporter [Malonomonas rubra]SHJ29036.1 Na+-driven multidrug efflux pump [Malonomonas rubra DSM 5091]